MYMCVVVKVRKNGKNTHSRGNVHIYLSRLIEERRKPRHRVKVRALEKSLEQALQLKISPSEKMILNLKEFVYFFTSYVR